LLRSQLQTLRIKFSDGFEHSDDVLGRDIWEDIVNGAKNESAGWGKYINSLKHVLTDFFGGTEIENI